MKNKAADKNPQPENTRGKYEEKLAVKGSFLDIIKASVKDANSKVPAKKEPKT